MTNDGSTDEYDFTKFSFLLRPLWCIVYASVIGLELLYQLRASLKTGYVAICDNTVCYISMCFAISIKSHELWYWNWNKECRIQKIIKLNPSIYCKKSIFFLREISLLLEGETFLVLDLSLFVLFPHCTFEGWLTVPSLKFWWSVS